MSENDIKCAICKSKMDLLQSAVILNKYDTELYLCSHCYYMKFNQPYWLEEAYSEVIAQTDIGLVSRNLYVSRKLATLLSYLLSDNDKSLDAAGGYGLLTRLMRDKGFDFYSHDDYCENIFSKSFQHNEASESYTCVTAIEVMEHVQDPIEFISKYIKNSHTKYFIFTTLLYKEPRPLIGEWWYYCLETGQHISFYHKKSINRIANILDLNYYNVGIFHILSKKKLNKFILMLLLGKVSILFDFFIRIRRKSKLNFDLLSLKNQ